MKGVRISRTGITVFACYAVSRSLSYNLAGIRCALTVSLYLERHCYLNQSHIEGKTRNCI